MDLICEWNMREMLELVLLTEKLIHGFVLLDGSVLTEIRIQEDKLQQEETRNGLICFRIMFL